MYWNKQWNLSIKLVKRVCVCVSVAEVIENMYFSYEISLKFFIFQVFVYNIHVLYSSTEQQTVVLLPRSPSTSKTYLPIPVDNLEEEYRIRSADDGKLFREEYNVSVSWKNMIMDRDIQNTLIPSWLNNIENRKKTHKKKKKKKTQKNYHNFGSFLEAI